jgi:tryptophanyl-tRNA synthetase
MYPVLMAADILMFNAHQVPVATRCNTSKWRATSLPASTTSTAKALHPARGCDQAHVVTCLRLDGSQDEQEPHNTIPLFVPREQLRNRFSIVTDSRSA